LPGRRAPVERSEPTRKVAKTVPSDDPQAILGHDVFSGSQHVKNIDTFRGLNRRPRSGYISKKTMGPVKETFRMLNLRVFLIALHH
jgi:hypothetical protein